MHAFERQAMDDYLNPLPTCVICDATLDAARIEARGIVCVGCLDAWASEDVDLYENEATFDSLWEDTIAAQTTCPVCGYEGCVYNPFLDEAYHLAVNA